jgi:hypothetical protein
MANLPKKPVAAGDAIVGDSSRAPFVYFDRVLGFGAVDGSIQLELVATTIIPMNDGSTRREVVVTAHLRGTEAAAKSLQTALDAALGMGRLLREDAEQVQPFAGRPN